MAPEDRVFDIDGMIAHTPKHDCLFEGSDHENGVVKFCETKRD